MSFRRFYRQYNPPKDTKSMLFDKNDPYTMASPKDWSTKWSDATVKLAKSSVFGVLTVYDNTFGCKEVLDGVMSDLKKMYPIEYKTVGTLSTKDHCDFCGQSITYVAVIVRLLGPARSIQSVHQIGCDCLGKIFGVNWGGYRNADSAKKSLIAAAKKRKRAIEYPVKYAKELTWINSLNEVVLNSNQYHRHFILDMKKHITTGDCVISKKMENYLHSLMSDKKFDPKVAVDAELEYNKTVDKVRGILHLVEEIDDAEQRTSQYSAYPFVKSVLDKLEQYRGKLSPVQMNALNKVYVRYKNIRVKSSVNQMKGDANEIPW